MGVPSSQAALCELLKGLKEPGEGENLGASVKAAGPQWEGGCIFPGPSPASWRAARGRTMSSWKLIRKTKCLEAVSEPCLQKTAISPKGKSAGSEPDRSEF